MNRLMSRILCVLCCFHVISSSSVCAQQLYHPDSIPGNQVVHHKYYSLSYNERHEQASWVYYILTKEQVLGKTKRMDKFRPDPLVVTGSAELKDYKESGYDRGHLAPSADMKINDTAMLESFFMSNMSPQKPAFNRQIWRYLEAQVRCWAVLYDSIEIYTGSVFTLGKDTVYETIGENEVTVPPYFYKVIYRVGVPQAIGLLIANEEGKFPLTRYVVEIDSIESLTEIDFKPGYYPYEVFETVVEKYCQIPPNTWCFSSKKGVKAEDCENLNCDDSLEFVPIVENFKEAMIEMGFEIESFQSDSIFNFK